jgi:hypothetical protein
MDAWLDAMWESVKSLAVSTLGFDEDSIAISEDQSVELENQAGSYMALVSVEESVQIGIVSDKAGCMTLSGALLGMEPEEAEELEDTDIADAMGEVINIVAGLVKTKMVENRPALNLGLPLFLDGHIEPTPNQTVSIMNVRLGEINSQIIVIRKNS